MVKSSTALNWLESSLRTIGTTTDDLLQRDDDTIDRALSLCIMNSKETYDENYFRRIFRILQKELKIQIWNNESFSRTQKCFLAYISNNHEKRFGTIVHNNRPNSKFWRFKGSNWIVKAGVGCHKPVLASLARC